MKINVLASENVAIVIIKYFAYQVTISYHFY